MTLSGATIPVLLDTDIGSDIDDALALAYLLRQPRCDLVGVTTVSGDVAQRSACARALCMAAGRDDVPIHDGASDVILSGPGQPRVPHYEVIAADVPAVQAKRDAIDFLRDSIRARPHEITLISIGPLTNIALLFAIDPEIPSLLGSLVSMAGSFTDDSDVRAEWNVKVDPVAAAMTYKRAPRGHLSVGIDVTQRCHLPIDDCRRRLRRPPLDVASAMAEIWFRTQDRIVFHDPLAAALVFRPEICDYVEGDITVDVVDGDDCGVTRLSTPSPGDQGRHRIASTVDPEAFFDEFFGVVDRPDE